MCAWGASGMAAVRQLETAGRCEARTREGPPPNRGWNARACRELLLRRRWPLPPVPGAEARACRPRRRGAQECRTWWSPPSYFAWQLRETRWLPTTKGLMKPSPGVFVRYPEVDSVAGDLVQYVVPPPTWEPDRFLEDGRDFFAALGLSTS